MQNENFKYAALSSRIDRIMQSDTPKIPKLTFRGQGTRPPSMDTGIDNAPAKITVQYTGSEMLGVVVMHKSCLQPVFNQQAAIDAANMRR